MAGPGQMGDCDAIDQVSLGYLVGQLPDGYHYAIAGCAYKPSEKLVPIYGGAAAKKQEL